MSFTPHERIFGPTYGLDHRLFVGQQLKPEIRKQLLTAFSDFCLRHGYKNWSRWAKIYFAGSEASAWTSPDLEGNRDFDTLVGIDYRGLRNSNPQFADMTNIEASTFLTNQMKAELNNPHFHPGGDPNDWDQTWYINPDSYDIKQIRPYAAYDVTADEWAVKPPELPHWSMNDLPHEVVEALRASERLALAVLKLPEPQRTQEAASLYDAWHSDRSRAFSEFGEGWYDIANLREKYLDQEGLWAQLVDFKHKWDEGLGKSPDDWSNTPPGYVAARRNPHQGEGPWFHGTNADLKPGDILHPGDQGEKSHGHFSDGSKVWISNDPWRASAYGHRTFAVEPHSTPRSPYANHDEHHTIGATILHEVDRAGKPLQRTASSGPFWISDRIVMGPAPGIFKSKPVNSVGEAHRVISQGWTAIIPEGNFTLAWLVARDLGMDLMNVKQRLDLARGNA